MAPVGDAMCRCSHAALVDACIYWREQHAIARRKCVQCGSATGRVYVTAVCRACYRARMNARHQAKGTPHECTCCGKSGHNRRTCPDAA